MVWRSYDFGSPWREIERLQREMNRLFADVATDYTPRVAPGYPAMNIWTNEEGGVITAELPGLSPDDIDISVVGETLTLSGERKADKVGDDVRYHRQERGYGKFSRTIQLPFQVDADKVEAVFEKGVLHIALPRAEADKPRKIAVKTA